jgi:hypothetical protein
MQGVTPSATQGTSGNAIASATVGPGRRTGDDVRLQRGAFLGGQGAERETLGPGRSLIDRNRDAETPRAGTVVVSPIKSIRTGSPSRGSSMRALEG